MDNRVLYLSVLPLCPSDCDGDLKCTQDLIIKILSTIILSAFTGVGSCEGWIAFYICPENVKRLANDLILTKKGLASRK